MCLLSFADSVFMFFWGAFLSFVAAVVVVVVAAYCPLCLIVVAAVVVVVIAAVFCPSFSFPYPAYSLPAVWL